MTLRYSWRTGDRFGFIKTAWLSNLTNPDAPCDVEVLDGFQNLLPANISYATQNVYSCLLDAYKRSELDEETNLGLFGLNSRLTDLAEPSESLTVNVVFQVGLEPQHVLLSSRQLGNFRFGKELEFEKEIRGERGAYFVHACLHLEAEQMASWYLVADVDQDHASLAQLQDFLRLSHDEKQHAIETDIQLNASNLQKFVTYADGLQVSEKPRTALTIFRMSCSTSCAVVSSRRITGSEGRPAELSLHPPTRSSNDSCRLFAALPERFTILDLRAPPLT